jgi:transglutaminase-like putative cysteine protease
VLVVGPEEVTDVDGAKRSLVRLDLTLDVFPIRTSMWLDAEGALVQTRTDVGFLVETFRTTKERATGAQETKAEPTDLFMDSVIKTRHLIPHARSVDSALLRLKRRDPDAEVPPLDDERQKVEKREGDTILVRVRRVEPPQGATGRRPLAEPPAEMAPYLAPTAMLQADDPLIRKAAEEAVAGETDAWKAAKAIERWVYRGIDKKNFGVAFASALEVCRDREGDCTEHALLAAALCRAAGIPSRVVMGLVYLTGIFGGHAWSEVWIEGRWYALDAALGAEHVDPLHLALGRLAMEDATYAREFSTFMAFLGKGDVDVLEATWDGRTMRFDGDDAARAEGGTYVNRPWGLSVKAPEGFEVKPRGPAEGLSQRLVDLHGSPGGRERTVRVRAESVDPAEGLRDAVKPYAKDAELAEATVDGRPALVGTVSLGPVKARAAFVRDDRDSLFAFAVEPSEDAADAALLDAFLQGVDLDAETAPAK